MSLLYYTFVERTHRVRLQRRQFTSDPNNWGLLRQLEGQRVLRKVVPTTNCSLQLDLSATPPHSNMPFYQMLCIASHFREYKHIKELVTMSAKHVMDQGGVVRNIEYWGTRTLPQPMRRHRQVYTIGDYWTMYFDTSPHGLKSLTGVIRRDPRVIRWTMVKQGDKVGDVVLPREKTVTRTDYLNPPRDGSTSWSGLNF